MRRLGVVLILLLGVPGIARAQIDSREGIALQNQILQLRQEVEVLRRGGVSAAPAPSRPAAGGGGSTEIVQSLLDRVQRMEEEVRSLRGRAEQAEFRERQLRERVEKLEGDIDFRLQQIEGGRQGNATPPTAPPRGAPTPPTPQPPPAQPASVPRTPEQALSAGQAALGRRDFAAAEAAAREVIAARGAPRQLDAQILLGDALLGRRDFAGAAVAYDDARRRAPNGTRAPEATVGIANAFIGLNNNRDACTLLNELRSSGARLTPAVAERAGEARRRASCR
jgi:TolA-binding protein